MVNSFELLESKPDDRGIRLEEYPTTSRRSSQNVDFRPVDQVALIFFRQFCGVLYMWIDKE